MVGGSRATVKDSPRRFTRADVRGRRCLVMGLGLHGGGVAVANWLLRQGAMVRVTDVRPRAVLQPSLARLHRSRRLSLTLAGHHAADFRWADVVVQNPAVPKASPYLRIARHAGARIENEATLFFQLVGRDRIVGVTGTRGKSTTAALAAHLLRQRYPATMLGGNIATTPMFNLAERAGHSRALVVLELSSWHLENLGAQGWSPHVAVVTNVLHDHLDRYPTFAGYVAAKRQILAHQGPGDYAVLNWDNPITRGFGRSLRSTVVPFSLRPRRGARVSVVAGTVCWQAESQRQRLFAAGDRQIAGDHNLANILAAVAVAKLCGVPSAAIARGVASFRGLPFRQELIGRRLGVAWVNDSTATTPDATMAALTTLTQSFRPRIILIAGGSDKRLPTADFLALARKITLTCRAVLLLRGEGSRRIARALASQPTLPVVTDLASMREAVALAASCADAGDVVLLSPACASFGLFVHEFDRGDQFTQVVKSIN